MKYRETWTRLYTNPSRYIIIIFLIFFLYFLYFPVSFFFTCLLFSSISFLLFSHFLYCLYIPCTYFTSHPFYLTLHPSYFSSHPFLFSSKPRYFSQPPCYILHIPGIFLSHSRYLSSHPYNNYYYILSVLVYISLTARSPYSSSVHSLFHFAVWVSIHSPLSQTTGVPIHGVL